MSTTLYTRTKVTEPAARLNPRSDPDEPPFAVVELGGYNGYISGDTPDDLLPWVKAFAQAVRLLDPAQVDDLLFDAVFGEHALAKIRERVNAGRVLALVSDEPELPPWCSPGPPCAATAPGPAAHPYLTCTAVPGHDGDHVAYDSGGNVLCAWPPECHSCHAAGEAMHVTHISHEGRQVRIFLCQDKDACYARRDQRHSETAKAGA